MQHPNYLRYHRKRVPFTQKEVGKLIGVSRHVVGRAESGRRIHSVKHALAFEVIFGKSPRELFAALYSQVEERLMRRAAALETALREKADPESLLKLEHLNAMMRRAVSRDDA